MLRLVCLTASIALAAPTLASGGVAQDSVTGNGAALYAARCASCHDDGAVSRVPSRVVIGALPADRIVQALTTGVMQVQGETLSESERRAIAAFLSTATNATSAPTARTCAPRPASSPVAAGSWNGWGVTLANDRYQSTPGLTLAEVPSLRLKWAFGFEGETAAATQPTIVGGRVFIGSGSGRVYALGLDDGCVDWTFKAEAGVRAAITIGGTASNQTAYIADMRATVYAIDAATASVRWQRRVEDHRSSRITGTPVLVEGRLYVPVSSGEEGIGAQPGYECCTFRGSVVALDAATGAVIWKTYLIQDEPKPSGRNRLGTQLWAPSGAAVWSSPTIDPSTRALYVATGDAYTHPAAPTTDAVIALDLASGAIKWTRQLLAGDAWNMACGSLDATNCPDNAGPDADFGQPPILVTLPSKQRVLAIAQKSALAYGLDPDDGGRVMWTTRIGRGGIIGGAEWGSASDGTHIYVPLSDLTFKTPEVRGRGGLEPSTGGGLFAIRLADGSQTWSAKPPPCGVGCSGAQSAPASLMPGAVFSGSLDGHLRAYATTDGRVLWDFDTARDFDTVNGVKANGGSIDVGGPAIASGMVLTTSGYGTWGGKRGNVLLAFGIR
jgi:polyvinyl alcohol dehydrogenase (cytochrome)